MTVLAGSQSSIECVLAELDEARRRHDAGQPVWTWFDRKVGGHMAANAALPKVPVPPPMAGAALRARLAQPVDRPRVLYVHVPFCSRICSFCGFFRKATGSNDLQAYTEAVAVQLSRVASTPYVHSGRPLSAVYFGGGTPTVLPVEQLAGLVSIIRGRFPLAEQCEFTVECRFEGLTEAALERLRDAGVNRLSFGVQSFDTDVRRGVGRVADRETVLKTLVTARRVGFDRISVDLIYNLPGQTSETWARTLDDLAESPATATSVYALIPMKNSALVKQIEAGKAPPLGTIEHEHALFNAAHDLLTDRPGWSVMSFHHFGDREREINVYNRVRAGGMDTIGVGCGAGGQIGSLAYMNAMSIPSYTAAQTYSSPTHDPDAGVMAFEHPAAVAAHTSAYSLTESDGVRRDVFESCLPDAASVLAGLIDLGLVIECGCVLRLSREGCFWGYNITEMITHAIADAMGDVPMPSGMPPHAGMPVHLPQHTPTQFGGRGAGQCAMHHPDADGVEV